MNATAPPTSASATSCDTVFASMLSWMQAAFSFDGKKSNTDVTNTKNSSSSSLPAQDSLALVSSPSNKCGCCASSNTNKSTNANTNKANKSTNTNANKTNKHDHHLHVSIGDAAFNHDDASDAGTLSPTSPSSEAEAERELEPVVAALPHEYLNKRLEQSPIDILEMESHLEVVAPGTISVSLSESDAEIVHLGNNFEIRWNKSHKRNVLTICGKVFYAVQFHFHTPSEHTINGKKEAMEFHMVHQADDGNLAVVAVFFREGAENPFLSQFWHELPGMDPKVRNKVSVGKIDPHLLDLLSGRFFRYRGSLTTPPYSEGVEWIIVKDVAEASREQILTFMDVLPSATNARAVQPLNKRRVSLVEEHY